MGLPIRLISTDFDGTLHTDLENPPVPHALQDLLGGLQTRGAIWVINTGRDLASLTDTLRQCELSVRPDYAVTVEREIYFWEGTRFAALDDWNAGCKAAHDEVFERVKPLLPDITAWIKARFEATVYEDPYSPFCLIGRNVEETDQIVGYLESESGRIPDLAVVRNHVYARLSHAAYNKGTALTRIGRRVGVQPSATVAVGDHYNDLPMLSRQVARWLVAPSNAIEEVKERVAEEGGHVSEEPYGYGVMDGLEQALERARSFASLTG